MACGRTEGIGPVLSGDLQVWILRCAAGPTTGQHVVLACIRGVAVWTDSDVLSSTGQLRCDLRVLWKWSSSLSC